MSTLALALALALSLVASLAVQAKESDREAIASRLDSLEVRAKEARGQTYSAWWRARALQEESAWKEFQAASEAAQAAFAAWTQEARIQEDWALEARISEEFWVQKG